METAEVAPPAIDFSECEREPIHAPLRVQRHGAIVVADISGSIIAASESSSRILDMPAQKLIGASMKSISEKWGIAFSTPPPAPELARQSFQLNGAAADLYCHSYIDKLFFEIERPGVEHKLSTEAAETVQQWQRVVQGGVAGNIFRASQMAATAYRALTGYDRVMVYRFHPDWSGEVIAESKKAESIAYLGLRYPATDIPSQARALFFLNPTRVICDVDAFESPLMRADGIEPIDCSHCRLRGTSPYHLEYLQNMGVKATMVQAIRQDDRLWGLIVGHHDSPRKPADEQRQAAEQVACELSDVIQREEYATSERNRRLNDNTIAQLNEDFERGGLDSGLRTLFAGNHNLRDRLDAHGVVISLKQLPCFAGLGAIAGNELIECISGRLDENPGQVVAIDGLHKEFNIRENTSGAMGISIDSHYGPLRLIAFRKETQTEVFWGGDPTAAAIVGEDKRLHPRKSFDLWRETVRDCSRPWQQREQSLLEKVAKMLGQFISDQPDENAVSAIFDNIYESVASQGAWEGLLLASMQDGLALAVDQQNSDIPNVIGGNVGMRRILDSIGNTNESTNWNECFAAAGLPDNFLNGSVSEFECWTSTGMKIFSTRKEHSLTIRTRNRSQTLSVFHFEDVTANKRILEAMTVAHDQAKAIINSQQSMLGSVGHEIRTPLNAILGLTEVMLSVNESDPDTLLSALKDIKKAGMHLHEMLEDMLSMASLQSGKLRLDGEKEENIADLIDEAISWAKQEAEKKNISVSPVASQIKGDIHVRVDPAKFRSVLLNLLQNAIKYSPQNSRIGVDLLGNVDKTFEIDVWDEGVGIHKSQLEQIFQPFHRINDSRAGYTEGSGLGLSLAKSIVELHGGRISVQSEPNKGSHFIIELPTSRVRLVKK